MIESVSVSQEVDESVWKPELDSIAQRYHTIGGWVAFVLNPLWAISDYFITPAYWKIFLVIRVIVSVLTLGGLLLQKRLRLPPEVLLFIPFLGIALQNAYMYSVMDVETVQKHTFAYIALFIGAGMLAMGKVIYTVIVVVATLVVNIILFIWLSPLSTEEILVNGGLLTATVAIFTIVLVQTRYNLTVKEIKARMALAISNSRLETQNEVIQKKNEQITSSIRYAKKIQEAMLPDRRVVGSSFEDLFLIYTPKDIVSGDFYWYLKDEDQTFIAAVDCTGHGVPGAFMSMIGSSLLNQVIKERQIYRPGIILRELRIAVIEALNKHDEENTTRDGMDLALCRYDHHKHVLEFAGAYNNLIRIRNGELEVFKADRTPIGVHVVKDEVTDFQNYEIEVLPGDQFYIFSDGFQDQFGGDGHQKLGARKFKSLLLENSHLPLTEQKDALKKVFREWIQDYSQMDDILLIGFRPL